MTQEHEEELDKCRKDPVYFYKKYIIPTDPRPEEEIRAHFDRILNMGSRLAILGPARENRFRAACADLWKRMIDEYLSTPIVKPRKRRHQGRAARKRLNKQ